jgi:predicted AlkP superfamily phosphohydrolase/phosphomutase
MLGVSGDGPGATGPPRSAGRPRVTIIGVDGATWRVIDPLIEQGALPNFARLVARGVRAPLRSRIPLWSPAVWTTIASGVRRERHGIPGFLDADGHLIASTHRRTPTLWTLASGAGLRSAVVGWWVTYPAEAISGVIVSERALKSRNTDLLAMETGHDASTDANRFVHPPEAARVVADLIAGLPERPAEEQLRETTIPRMRAEDGAVIMILERLRQQLGPFDLEMILLRGTDPVSHHFWNFYEPTAPAYADAPPPSAEERARYGTAVQDHYRYVDELLGRLALDPTPEHSIFLLSDHGFEASSEGPLPGNHHTIAAVDGIFVASGGPFRSGARLERLSIVDVAPTVLHALGLPVARSLDGRVVTEAMREDWLAAHPVHAIADYPGPPVLLPPGAAASSTDSPADARMEEQLRSLGYIE